MRKNLFVLKGLTFCIILLLIDAAMGPAVAFMIPVHPVPSDSIPGVASEKSKVTCRYFTLRGIEEVQQEIPRQDADRLSMLMNGSDVITLARELPRLGLVPSSMNVEQIRSLISGESLQKACAPYRDTIAKVGSEQGSGVKQNVLCALNGEAGSYITRNLRAQLFGVLTIYPSIALMLLDLLLQAVFPKYPLIFKIPVIPGMYWGFGPIGTFAWLLILLVTGIIELSDHMPGKLGLFQRIVLQESFNGPPVTVHTSGVAGNWSLNGSQIQLSLIGFVGLGLLAKNPDTGYSKFIGASLYVRAEPTN